MILESAKDFKINIKTNTRLIGLDVGDKKIGIALSDRSQMVANAHDVLIRQKISKDLGVLNALCNEQEVSGVVIGLPISTSGTENENCEKIRHFAKKISDKTNLPVLLCDERMSTTAADKILKESGMTRKKRNQIDDKIAAALILQVALDSFSYLGN